MDMRSVEKSYVRWARIYDQSFGVVTSAARRRAAEVVGDLGGEVLEVGVGTGLALPHYGAGVRVTGIDYSADMLAKARARVARMGLARNASLRQMDARAMDFPDASFDTVAAMHILSVVPEPEKVMAEIARVVRPGGRVVIVNHFASPPGPLAWVERRVAAFDDILTWQTVFPRERVLREPSLVVERETRLPPFGLMTLLVLRKAA